MDKNELPVRMRPTFSHSLDPKQTYMTDRYQNVGLMPIRIRTREKWSSCRNSVDKRRARRIIHK